MKKRTLFYWIIPIILMILIFLFSAQPADVSTKTSQSFGNTILSFLDSFGDFSLPTAAEIDTFIRKAAHFAVYALLGASFYVALRHSTKTSFGALSLFLSLLYAMSDELHQYFVPGRSAQVTDVLLDFSGSVVGILFIFFIGRLLAKKRSH